MEINTVVISLDRLKELELAEDKINKPRSKTIIIESVWGNYFKIETDDECDAKLANEIKRMQEEINDVKKMNYLDFLKWKKS